MIKPYALKQTKQLARRLTDYTAIKCKTVQLQNSFLPKSIKEWNALPLTFREAETKDIMKAKLSPPKKDRFCAVELTRWSSILMSSVIRI